MTDQRNLMYQAYMMQVEDVKYTIFKSSDLTKRLDSDIFHTTALIHKCIKAGLIAKVGRDVEHDGRANLYTLTELGNSRGLYYMRNFNPITQTLRTNKEE